jgi:hypothetical protein
VASLPEEPPASPPPDELPELLPDELPELLPEDEPASPLPQVDEPPAVNVPMPMVQAIFSPSWVSALGQ